MRDGDPGDLFALHSHLLPLSSGLRFGTAAAAAAWVIRAPQVSARPHTRRLCLIHPGEVLTILRALGVVSDRAKDD